MPCSDGRDADELRRTQQRLDLATRLLCEVMGTQTIVDPSDELMEWWIEHKVLDAARNRG